MRDWNSFLAGLALLLSFAHRSDAACCYFSAKNADILQPAQKVFLTYDPKGKFETFTVQPKFEGNALDFGMVIPTPTQPKLHEMPRDFFKHLAVYSILKRRERPLSTLAPFAQYPIYPRMFTDNRPVAQGGPGYVFERKPVRILEAGLVGSLDYKIIETDRADALFQWLKDHKYRYAGDEATLNHYVQNKWIFTVMKIDTMQMKRNKDGTFAGEVTPTRFQFVSEKFVYPLKITQISVKDKTEALFYVQAPFKCDLQGDFTYQMTWLPLLESTKACMSGGIPGGGEAWLKKSGRVKESVLERAEKFGFEFIPNQRPKPGIDGRIPTTMEWAKKLTESDVRILRGEDPYSEKVPNPDEGFRRQDLEDPNRREAVLKVIRNRLLKSRREHPLGYLVREAPKEEVATLRHLVGHLQAGQFVTKFRKVFLTSEMNDDLIIIPARYGDAEDESEYEEILPDSPP